MKKTILYFNLFTLLIFFGCRKSEEVKPDTDLNNYLYTLMQQWYFWNDKMPVVNPNNYSSPESLLEALKYKTYDRWSFITDSVTYFQYFSGGQMQGFGCGFKLNSQNQLFVSYVYKQSPMASAGVTRGWEVKSINGTSVESLIASNKLNEALSKDGSTSFSFLNTQNQALELSISKGNVIANTVLHYEVKNVSGKMIGYLVFNSFIETSKAELDQAFQFFQSNNISDLIVDFRYNGGGMVSIANYLSSCIGGSKVAGGIFSYTKHNKDRASNDNTSYFESSNYNLNINKLVFITTKSSASASELVINNLKPYMNVSLVGTRTHGKPVGMYSWSYKGKVIVPISFEIVNKNNQGQYFNGIEVNSAQVDDLARNFGDIEEDCLQEAMQYISNGVFTGHPARISGIDNNKILQRSGFEEVVGAY